MTASMLKFRVISRVQKDLHCHISDAMQTPKLTLTCQPPSEESWICTRTIFAVRNILQSLAIPYAKLGFCTYVYCENTIYVLFGEQPLPLKQTFRISWAAFKKGWLIKLLQRVREVNQLERNLKIPIVCRLKKYR